MASLRDLASPAHFTIASWFVAMLEQAGLHVVVTSTRRDLETQKRLYADYKAGRSKYPAAPPGHSQHDRGMAFDLHLDPPEYAAAGALWERLGLTWGGRFNDEIHFDFRKRA